MKSIKVLRERKQIEQKPKRRKMIKKYSLPISGSGQSLLLIKFAVSHTRLVNFTNIECFQSYWNLSHTKPFLLPTFETKFTLGAPFHFVSLEDRMLKIILV